MLISGQDKSSERPLSAPRERIFTHQEWFETRPDPEHKQFFAEFQGLSVGQELQPNGLHPIDLKNERLPGQGESIPEDN
jgi:hypothetical protein